MSDDRRVLRQDISIGFSVQEDLPQAWLANVSVVENQCLILTALTNLPTKFHLVEFLPFALPEQTMRRFL